MWAAYRRLHSGWTTVLGATMVCPDCAALLRLTMEGDKPTLTLVQHRS